MNEEPEADALIAVDQKARDEQRDDDRDEPDDGRDVVGHAVLEPRDQDANARKKERENEKPEGDAMRCQIEMDVHGGADSWACA